MIHTETLDNGLIRHYSDEFMIRKVGMGEIYAEAIDVPTSGYEYEETDQPLTTFETLE